MHHDAIDVCTPVCQDITGLLVVDLDTHTLQNLEGCLVNAFAFLLP